MAWFHLGQYRNLKHYYINYVQKHMQSEFPDTVSYNRFVELQQKVLMLMVLFFKSAVQVTVQGYHLLTQHRYGLTI